MEHAKTINDLMPCDKSGDFLAVWVEAMSMGYKVTSSGITHGYIEDPALVITALEALPEHARPQYLVEAAS